MESKGSCRAKERSERCVVKDIKLTWTCLDCEHDFILSVSPIIPAKLYGPPENCHPEEGGVSINQDEAIEAASEKWQDDRDSAAEAKIEDWKERNL